MTAPAIAVRACAGCGCTDDRACPGGCSWARETVCSTCAETERLLVRFRRAPRGTRLKALSPLQAAVRERDRTYGRSFADLMLKCAALRAVGNSPALEALIDAHRRSPIARMRSLVRATRLPAVMRAAREFAEIARRQATRGES